MGHGNGVLVVLENSSNKVGQKYCLCIFQFLRLKSDFKGMQKRT